MILILQVKVVNGFPDKGKVVGREFRFENYYMGILKIIFR
jgi:hypothetical protein